MNPNYACGSLNNDWVFRSHCGDSTVARLANSISTVEREEAEKATVAWLRDHPRRPVTEWSDYTDPFEPAGREDWSPVRSVMLATPATPGKKC